SSRYGCTSAERRTSWTRASCSRARGASTARTWTACGARCCRCRPSASGCCRVASSYPRGCASPMRPATPPITSPTCTNPPAAPPPGPPWPRPPGGASGAAGAGGGIAPGPTLAPTPPPDIDLRLWRESIELLEDWRPQALAITHFGAHHDVEAHLQGLRDYLD